MTMATNTTPLEDDEQKDFVMWAREQGIKLSSINQSTFTKSFKQINRLKALGTSKGIPDLLLAIPPQRRLDGKWKVIFVEMKRQKGGYASKEQKEWIAILNDSNIPSEVCKGSEEAKTWVSQFIEKDLPEVKEEDLEDFINNL